MDDKTLLVELKELNEAIDALDEKNVKIAKRN